MCMSHTRQQELLQWIQNRTSLNAIELVPLQGDASLRTFYRLNTVPSTILIDAAADLKKQEFVDAANLLQHYNLKTPKIFSHDIDLGLFQVEDFGDQLLFNHIDQPVSENFLKQAIDAILKIQQIPASALNQPTSFDAAFIDRELNLFSEWFLDKYLKFKLSAAQKKVIGELYIFIRDVLLSKSYVCMHRDFHSKNIMILPDQSLGLLDFQDLMLGPITYDLMSLLKDCYVTWPEKIVETLLIYYYQSSNKLNFKSYDEFVFYFDVAGLQRHLKVLGGFSKIYLSRNNSYYLQYFDRILDYVMQVAAKYPELDQFKQILNLVVIEVKK